MHQTHTREAKHIGDLMRVGEHRRCAMRNHSARELSRGEHTALNMHMPVAQTWDHVTTLCVYHLRVRPDAMVRVRSTISETPVCNGKIVVFEAFAGVHIHPCAIFDHKVSG